MYVVYLPPHTKQQKDLRQSLPSVAPFPPGPLCLLLTPTVTPDPPPTLGNAVTEHPNRAAGAPVLLATV